MSRAASRVSRDQQTAYVALAQGSSVAIVDLPKLVVKDKITVGRWPRFLALSVPTANDWLSAVVAISR